MFCYFARASVDKKLQTNLVLVQARKKITNYNSRNFATRYRRCLLYRNFAPEHPRQDSGYLPVPDVRKKSVSVLLVCLHVGDGW